MSQTIKQALSDATLFSDDLVYRFVKLPANAITMAAGIVAEAGNPFCALIVDKDEVTLMLPSQACEEFQNRLKYATISDIQYRLITFDVILEPTLIGFMAHITKALGESNISVMPYAAFSRDHIFVAEADFDKALSTLNSLQ
jgi:hypothetical protein